MQKRYFFPPGGRLALALVFLLCVACRPASPSYTYTPTAPVEAPEKSVLPEKAILHLQSTPEGAQIQVDGQASGQTPAQLELSAGERQIEISISGYAPWSSRVSLLASSTFTLTGLLRDVAPPEIHLGEMPARLEKGASLLVQASAQDNEGVASLSLWLDDERQAATIGDVLTYRWDTSTADPGSHLLRIEAADQAGNAAHKQVRIEIGASAPAPALAVAQALPSPTATSPATRTVTVRTGSLTISTYQYRQALYTDAASACYPYPLLNRSQVGQPAPMQYETTILENEYLRLVFLPALGGRLYQCVYLPTSQEIFYNNQVIKPSHWGPPEMGWWLAAGGIEWCLPVEEHGYVSAEPWAAQTAQSADGSASITLTHTEQTRNILAAVTVTLRPGEASFTITPRLENPDAESKNLQYWLNAMISLGNASLSPRTQFLLPASEVIVHSAGDSSLGGPHSTLPWPAAAGGRDLSRYESWRDWLGVFAPSASAGYMGAFSPDSDLGIIRVFPLEQVPGIKLFAFGQEFGDVASYTDDESQYAELWGGLTPTFWDSAILPAHGSIQWTETWFPVHGLGGLSGATAQAAYLATWDGQEIRLAVTTPRSRELVVTVSDENGELYRQACVTGPAQPFVTAVRPKRDITGSLIMRLLGEDGNPLAEHVVGSR